MKYLSLFCFFLFSYCFSMAQKHDNNWLFGYEAFGRPRFILNFDGDTARLIQTTWTQRTTYSFFSMSDSQGRLQFYTNGLEIYNADHTPMENGDSINIGRFWDSAHGSGDGYPDDTGYLILPFPGKDRKDKEYLIFYLRFEYDQNLRSPVFVDNFQYSIVKMENETIGKVSSKNISIISNDTLKTGKLTACKHANGRDWWILIGRYDSNEFYTILVTPEGPSIQGIQTIGAATPNGLGQAVFSPDGSKYIVWNAVDLSFDGLGHFVDIYDFDRCTGELSNPKKLNYIDTSVATGGVAVSPNSRFLYLFNSYHLYQYDLWQDDVFATKDTIATYDGFVDPFPAAFFYLMLAPDGKIYGSCTNGQRVLHVINKPDEKGTACDFRQHSFHFPKYIGSGLPNFPNYRLGRLAGSVCDSLVNTRNFVHNSEIVVYPNPAEDVLNVEITKEKVPVVFDFQIIDAFGRIVDSGKFSRRHSLSVSSFLPGIYFLQLKSGDRILNTTRFMVVR